MMEDELKLDYGPMEGEIPDQDSKNRIRGTTQTGKGRLCPVCQGRFTNVRRHVLHMHLPWYTAPLTACWSCNCQFGQERMLQVHIIERHNSESEGHCYGEQYGNIWVERMNGLLLELCQQYNRTTLDQLRDHVNTDVRFKICNQAFFHSTDMKFVKLFNLQNHYDVQLVHSVYPPTHISSLLHWKILSMLIFQTGNSENLIHFDKQELLYKCTNIKEIQVSDAHLHMDIICKTARSSGLPQYKWEDSDQTFKVAYLITNFAFPNKWPSTNRREEIRKDERIRMTIGIHPRLVNLEGKKGVERWLKDLDILAGARNMVAIGECGLDSTDKPSSRELQHQSSIFEAQLKVAKKRNLPVVIHCRGDQRIQSLCLDILCNNLSTDHAIHWHCFNSSLEDYKIKKLAFKNSKFGISPFLLMDNKYPDFRSTVCNMELSDILLETDSPYLSPSKRVPATPLLLQEILWKMATMFNTTQEEIAQTTTVNVKRLYRI